ncbi:S1C family serine protease [Deinococcus planocerae]|uniref:S1C family serine protease n=1 Tax=Deinococcus planocerae TaxID=1737569 RepID=UPI000C7F6321|nr:trypsin-like peptidase domain-containing protein [Deinococcus planocerae]
MRPIPLLTSLLLLAAPAASAQTAPAPPRQTPAAPTQAAPSTLRPDELSQVEVLERSLRGVVYISAETPGDEQPVFSSPLFEDPRGGVEQSSGSGFFVDAQGYALTNFHVVEGATRLSVRLLGQSREFPARVVGTAPDYDLALIQVQNVPAGLIRPLPLGDSTRLRVGQRVFAIGAPLGQQFSASEGIVSAVERTIPTGQRQVPQNAIQTDAAINPGNSGGPLLNSAGQVIGINTQILSPSGAVTGIGQSAGIGFAIPSNVAGRLLPRLRAGETVTGPRIGVVLAPFELSVFSEQARRQYNLPREGALVVTVEPNGPAARGGLRGGTQRINTPFGPITLGGDVITAVNGQPIETSADLRERLFSGQVGETLRLTVVRGGQTVQVPVTLAPGTPPSTGQGR